MVGIDFTKKNCLFIHSFTTGGQERVMSVLANYMSKQYEAHVVFLFQGIILFMLLIHPVNCITHHPVMKKNIETDLHVQDVILS